MEKIAQIAAVLGNKELLKLKKTAFLCSRKIPASAVLKCYDWAIEQREKGNCVISGFHSKLEKRCLSLPGKRKAADYTGTTKRIKNKMGA